MLKIIMIAVLFPIASFSVELTDKAKRECYLKALRKLSTNYPPQIFYESKDGKVSTFQGSVPIKYTQDMFIKLILNHLDLGPNSDILEIGYGQAHLLQFVKDATEAKRVVGLDIFPPSSLHKACFPEIELKVGDFPRNGFGALDFITDGSYDLVYGVDIFKDTSAFKWGDVFNPGVSDLEYVQWLKNLLNKDGYFVMVNDFDAKTNFSREVFEANGFEIISWGETIDKFKKAREAGVENILRDIKEKGENIGKTKYYILKRASR